jgi:hypothetical protein
LHTQGRENNFGSTFQLIDGYTGQVIETEKTNGKVTGETKEKGKHKLLRLEDFTP